MKILHVCMGADLLFQGGITNYVRSLATEQAKQGNNVCVMCDSSPKTSDYSRLTFSVKQISTTNSYRSFSKKNDKKCFLEVQSFLEKNQFDLIHIHMVLNLPPEVISLFEKYLYVVSLHDYSYICPRIQMLNGTQRCLSAGVQCKKCFSLLDKSFIGQRIYHRVFAPMFHHHEVFPCGAVIQKWRAIYYPFLKKAALLLPVSSRVQTIYENSGIRNKYRVLHIGNISAETFDKICEPDHHEKIKMVLLSSVSYHKGGKLFCEIYRKVQNPLLEIHFFGRTTKSERKMLEKAKIINHGPYKQDDLAKILSCMDMGIMTPIWEDNGPQVVMEMLNNHLPVFATSMGGIVDFVNNSNGFLFDPYSQTSIEEAIRFLNDLSFPKIKVLRQGIKKTLTPEEHFHEIDEVYGQIFSERMDSKNQNE